MERTELIKIDGGEIPIKVELINGEHVITVDGVEWVRTPNMIHSAVIFNMFVDHLTEYMDFKSK